MAKGIVKLGEDSYSIIIDEVNESEDVGYGEVAQVEVNGVLYSALVDLDGDGEDASPTDQIGDCWIYCGLAGVEVEDSDEDEEESEGEPEPADAATE